MKWPRMVGTVRSLPGSPANAVRNWVGNGVERLVERALTNDLNGKPDAVLFDVKLALPRASVDDCL